MFADQRGCAVSLRGCGEAAPGFFRSIASMLMAFAGAVSWPMCLLRALGSCAALCRSIGGAQRTPQRCADRAATAQRRVIASAVRGA
jgi:hypothetical protein